VITSYLPPLFLLAIEHSVGREKALLEFVVRLGAGLPLRFVQGAVAPRSGVYESIITPTAWRIWLLLLVERRLFTASNTNPPKRRVLLDNPEH
jgi:hypothetical protein